MMLQITPCPICNSAPCKAPATCAQIKQGKAATGGRPPLLSSADFIRTFVPPDYLIDGLLQRQFLYSLTGKTGAGKTAIALLFAACVALGRTIDGREFCKGRVLYLAGENPIDVQMRWIAMSAYQKGSGNPGRRDARRHRHYGRILRGR